ncbi:MAG: lysylphosphatidylglycerol synthase transmembrane domain-containing protein [Planctomycetota bacterium]
MGNYYKGNGSGKADTNIDSEKKAGIFEEELTVRKWIKHILGIIILAFLLAYLAEHRQELKTLLKLNAAQLGMMYLLCFLTSVASVPIVRALLAALKIRTGFKDMLLLNNAAIVLNYAPMKFGTVFRANYLKRHYSLSYAHFATFFLYITFLMTLIASAIGLAVLLGVYGITSHESKILAGIFVVTIAVSLIFLLIPLPAPKGAGRMSTALRTFITGRSQVSKQTKAVMTAVLFVVITFVLTAFRIGIIYHSMGREMHQAGYLILGALGFVVLFISITPGSLGIRELVLSCGAVVLGMPLEVGILAAMIDRAITVCYAFTAGSLCGLWLWHKSPKDFEKETPDT